MMNREMFDIARTYVPVKRRATLEPGKVAALAQSILNEGLKNPILVQPDGERFVLVEGRYLLEAAKSLGETTIAGFRVAARKH